MAWRLVELRPALPGRNAGARAGQLRRQHHHRAGSDPCGGASRSPVALARRQTLPAGDRFRDALLHRRASRRGGLLARRLAPRAVARPAAAGARAVAVSPHRVHRAGADGVERQPERAQRDRHGRTTERRRALAHRLRERAGEARLLAETPARRVMADGRT